MNSSSEKETDDDFLAKNDLNVHNDIQFEIPSIEINEKLIYDKIAQLNEGQKLIFDKIINQIEHQELHSNKKCLCQEDKQIKIFCSGVAGTCLFIKFSTKVKKAFTL